MGTHIRNPITQVNHGTKGFKSELIVFIISGYTVECLSEYQRESRWILFHPGFHQLETLHTFFFNVFKLEISLNQAAYDNVNLSQLNDLAYFLTDFQNPFDSPNTLLSKGSIFFALEYEFSELYKQLTIILSEQLFASVLNLLFRCLINLIRFE